MRDPSGGGPSAGHPRGKTLWRGGARAGYTGEGARSSMIPSVPWYILLVSLSRSSSNRLFFFNPEVSTYSDSFSSWAEPIHGRRTGVFPTMHRLCVSGSALLNSFWASRQTKGWIGTRVVLRLLVASLHPLCLIGRHPYPRIPPSAPFSSSYRGHRGSIGTLRGPGKVKKLWDSPRVS